MKTKLLLLAIMLFCILSNKLSAQKWEKDQPNKLFAVDKNGNFNNIKVGIGTNNPQYPLEVIGIAKIDSLVLNNGAHIFGKLHINKIIS